MHCKSSLFSVAPSLMLTISNLRIESRAVREGSIILILFYNFKSFGWYRENGHWSRLGPGSVSNRWWTFWYILILASQPLIWHTAAHLKITHTLKNKGLSVARFGHVASMASLICPRLPKMIDWLIKMSDVSLVYQHCITLMLSQWQPQSGSG